MIWGRGRGHGGPGQSSGRNMEWHSESRPREENLCEVLLWTQETWPGQASEVRPRAGRGRECQGMWEKPSKN